MRAALFHEHGGPEVIRVEEVELPEPGPGEVRVRVGASSLNHLDLWARRGLPFEIPMPHIGGSDVAGVVEAVGPGVRGVAAGLRVVVDPSLGYDWYQGRPSGPDLARSSMKVLGEHTQGGFAECCIVPAANLVQLPEEVGFEIAAAAALTFVTAWHGLIGRARVRAGERVLVTGGSGGVGSAGVQIAKLAGARVYAVTSGPENVRRLEALGAEVVYDRLEVDFSREVWYETGKEGVDVVLDSVGEATWNQVLRSLGPMGRAVVYGATTGPEVTTDLRLVYWRQLSILGTTMGSPAEFREVMRLVFEGRLRPEIEDVVPLEDVGRAHERLEGGDVFGKIVVRL